ncbi:hypothetical protein [Bradyrhizobium sp.]|uniref:hypothetical protein n=1 Tax=Bradyrhizobium sp. TaxID=376 RepID=UPI003C743594
MTATALGRRHSPLRTTAGARFAPAAGTLISAGKMTAAAITGKHEPANACSM